MKQLLCAAACFVCFTSATLADDLGALQGKWTTKKTAERGPVTQTMEFTNDKWIFKLAYDTGGGFVAKGKLELKKAGAFEIMRLLITHFGSNENELEEAGDERSFVYSIRDGKMFLVSNLDRERDNEPPALDVYSKSAEAPKASGIVGSWKLNLELNDTTYDYTLRIAETSGKLNAVLVSPRSGEHKVKSAAFENNTFKMEIDRELEGNPVIFAYTGKLDGSALSGKISVKGTDGNELASGTWSAKR